jgi:hypothetical protein
VHGDLPTSRAVDRECERDSDAGDERCEREGDHLSWRVAEQQDGDADAERAGPHLSRLPRRHHLAPAHADGTVPFEDYLAAHPDPWATSYRGKRS